jgi:hypothetical protein
METPRGVRCADPLSQEHLQQVRHAGERIEDAAGFFRDVRLAVMECFTKELFDQVEPDLRLNHAYIDASAVPWRLKAPPRAPKNANSSTASATGV